MKPRLKWIGNKWLPVNYEAVGIVLGWNIEFDLTKLYKKSLKIKIGEINGRL